jgi:hypothetical protein
MGVTWIASYPKSGNTWLRFLLANYLDGPIQTSAQVEGIVPSYTRELVPEAWLQARKTLFVKTHFRWGPEHPHAAITDRAIVIVRYPKDILLSALNYHRLQDGHDDGGYTDEAYARWFIQFGGDPRWLPLYGTLEQHIASWLGADLPHLLVRYEGLKADAAGELRRILAFTGQTADEDRVRRAVENSTFERMRAIEDREKAANLSGMVFATRPARPGWNRYFVSEGRTGSSLAHLGPDLDGLFDQRFAPVLHRLGYGRWAAGQSSASA